MKEEMVMLGRYYSVEFHGEQFRVTIFGWRRDGRYVAELPPVWELKEVADAALKETP